MADFELVTQEQVYNFTLETAAGVDQVARDAVAAVRQLPAGGATGQALQRTSSGYAWTTATSTDQTARDAAAAAQTAANTADGKAVTAQNAATAANTNAEGRWRRATLTQAAYDALTTKDPNTLYVIT